MRMRHYAVQDNRKENKIAERTRKLLNWSLLKICFRNAYILLLNFLCIITKYFVIFLLFIVII